MLRFWERDSFTKMLLSGVHNETLSIKAMRIDNPECAPVIIDG
jgi:hypothetical protein